MRNFGWGIALVLSACLGCAGKPIPAEQEAAEAILKAGGTLIVQGATVQIKANAKIPADKFNIRVVRLNGLKIRDPLMEKLKPLSELEELNLEGSYLTDAGMVHIQEMKNLQVLDLHKSIYVTDKGLESLKSLPKLSRLELSYTRTSDAGVDTLLALKKLKVLHLTGTRVTGEGVRKLKAGLTGCEVLK